MKAIIDKKVILQLVHKEHGVRSKEFATTFREFLEIVNASILPENHEKNLVLVLMQENEETGDMEFSNNALITVRHFVKLVEENGNV